ncbi:hypothetical protein SAMN02744124_00228 [Paenibacillus barengoltzii J12]|jgi:hypothetical protein|uniref:Uncharacterized protein n=2 Tax=Paenibacillus barengoltzii TaxID=343517 RepID=R9LIV5_9BACL|nr:hypothetical protein C812_00600 [Paenibacillus barengoltzii G22]SME92351.1 hypothetical protein SAMN02744124_00228 [Paenibacillus barengoltzii J12]
MHKLSLLRPKGAAFLFLEGITLQMLTTIIMTKPCFDLIELESALN